MTSEIIASKFGNRLRVRVSGILIENNRLLMVKHKGIGDLGYLWAPPGGGVDYGTSVRQNLEREFLEETGIAIDVKNFLFTCELINPPLHAIEMFFIVNRKGGKLKKGFDPELEKKDQIIESVKFLSANELKQTPQLALHEVLQRIEQLEDLVQRSGYYLI